MTGRSQIGGNHEQETWKWENKKKSTLHTCFINTLKQSLLHIQDQQWKIRGMEKQVFKEYKNEALG